MKTIILSRTDKIGDVILTLPMVVFLKQLYPGCRIIFIGRSYTRPVLQCNTQIDMILCWDELEKQMPGERIKLFRELKADAIFHVFPNKHIARDAFKAGIPLRIGTSHRLWHLLYCNKLLSFSRKNSELHEAQLNLKLISPFGFSNECSLDRLSELPLFDCVPEVDETVFGYIDKKRITLIFHPHSHGSAREWPLEYFVELCNLLDEKKYHIVFCGTSQEAVVYRSALKNIKREYSDAGGVLSLNQYISLISCSQGLVSASTGPLHIAAACGIHAVGIYPPIRPMHSGRWSPLGKHVHVLSVAKECSDCRTDGNCGCMKEILPLAVLDVIEKIGQ